MAGEGGFKRCMLFGRPFLLSGGDEQCFDRIDGREVIKSLKTRRVLRCAKCYTD
jgi:hypothetical protein